MENIQLHILIYNKQISNRKIMHDSEIVVSLFTNFVVCRNILFPEYYFTLYGDLHIHSVSQLAFEDQPQVLNK